MPTEIERLAYAGSSIIRQPARLVKTARRTLTSTLQLREHNRQRTTDPLSEREHEIACEESPDTAFWDKEVAQSITEAAAQLKPRERDFLRLYYYEELPKQEIARQLGIKEERLRLIKARTLKRFREIYDKLRRG